MEKKNLCVAFSTQKGGAGKSTMTVLVASYLHYVKGYNVAVVDCDYPQYSIAGLRKRELKIAQEDEYYRSLAYEHFTRLGKKMYPVVKSLPIKAGETAKVLIEKNSYDIIFFDLPGTVNQEGVIHTISQMDYIFSPISADRVVLESTLRFASRLNDTIITTGKSRIKGLHLIWNLVDGREKSELYDVYEAIIAQLQLPVMKTFLPDSKRFRRELSITHKPLFRSTLFPVDKALLKGSNVDLLTDELLNIVNSK